MKKPMRVLLTLLAVAVVGSGAYWIYRSRVVAAAATTVEQTATQTVEVKVGDLSSIVSVVGQLTATQSATSAFEQMSGTASLLSLDVRAGSTVSAGQVLATIDAAPYEQALDQAESDLSAAEEELADLQTPVTALQIAQADVAVTKAQVQLQQAQDALADLLAPDLESLSTAVSKAQSTLAEAQASLLELQQEESDDTQLQRLADTEADFSAEYTRLANETYSDTYYQDRLQLATNKLLDAQDERASYELNRQISLRQAQTNVRKAEAALADAQDALAEAQAGPDDLTLAQAEVAVREAQVSLLAAQEARADLDEGADATQIATAQAAVDKKRLTLSDAQAALAGTQLTAPFGGTVLETYTTAGSTVAANTTILSLANLDTLQVVAAVDETTIREVGKGQQATITFDAFPGRSFSGQVLDIPLQGELQGDVMVYSVPLSLVGAEDLPLLVGMTANVEIAVGRVTDALLVPTIALTQYNGLYQVLVPNTADPAGQPVAVPVEVGLSDGTYTAITKGLNAGDQVIVQMDLSSSDEQFGPMMGPGGRGEMGGGMPPSGGGQPPAPPSGG